ncbi:GNAT family N-acetyltransferase [Paraburkholderia phenoliruptrix]|uniref:GNAT family N-acetyltransferase n=1 Tax=Paraburkholderia phenoliruptrix TaxID=252970 RepID=UPI002869E10E|nr:GNAT family protein [Paraburkholderia phenoliruptrix]WMY11132.1 GNAT family protein [Paraburkholderia phenoliruptrix]
MLIRRLTPSDAPSFQTLRLAGLKETPTSFASSYEEKMHRSPDDIADRLAARDDRGVFGAFEGTRLIGMAGLGRENLAKLRHKAFVWGVYVAANKRGRGVSRMLVSEAIGFAQSVPGITQINLSVNACNHIAIRLYTSLGFKQFALEPASMIVDGKPYDEIHMSLRFEREAAPTSDHTAATKPSPI